MLRGLENNVAENDEVFVQLFYNERPQRQPTLLLWWHFEL
jgi:hypothetical protein